MAESVSRPTRKVKVRSCCRVGLSRIVESNRPQHLPLNSSAGQFENHGIHGKSFFSVSLVLRNDCQEMIPFIYAYHHLGESTPDLQLRIVLRKNLCFQLFLCVLRASACGKNNYAPQNECRFPSAFAWTRRGTSLPFSAASRGVKDMRQGTRDMRGG